MSTPSAPIISNAPFASPNSLEYFWYTPDSDSPITSYQLVLTSSEPTITCNISPTNYFKVTGLTNGLTYTTSIAASNVNGLGTLAYFRDFQPGSPPSTAPETATATKVSITNGSALVSWTPPSTTPDADILWYVIESSSTNPSDPVLKFTANGLTQSSYYVEGLNTNSSYRFNINAVNCPGYSPRIQTNLMAYFDPAQAKLATRAGGNGSAGLGALTVDSEGNVYHVRNYSDNLTIYNYSSAPVNGGEVGTSIYGILNRPLKDNSNIDINANAALIKYNSSGKVQWAVRVQPSSLPPKIITDKNGNVYYVGNSQVGAPGVVYGNQPFYNFTSAPVAGGTIGNTLYGTLPQTNFYNTQAFIVKYNPSGSVEWAVPIQGSAYNTDCVTDNDGNLYVCSINVNPDARYQTFNNFTGAPLSAGGSIRFTKWGEINLSTFALYIIKYNSSGLVQWATAITNIDRGDFALASIAIDSSGNLVVASSWGISSNSSSPYTLRAYSSAPVSAGSVGLTTWGTVARASYTVGMIIAKYNSNGTPLWGTYTQGGATGSDNALTVSCDAQNNIYVASGTHGQFAATLIPYNYQSGGGSGGAITTSSFGSMDISTGTSFVIKYNSSGVVQWANNSGSSSICGQSVCDSEGNFYLTSSALGTSGSRILRDYTSVSGGTITLTQRGIIPLVVSPDTYLIKYDTNGDAIWGVRIGGSLNESYIVAAVDSEGHVWIGGTYDSNPVSITNFSSMPALSTDPVVLNTYGTIPDINTSAGNNIFLIKYKS